MSQVLALEWNSHEIRVAAASARGSRIVIDHAFLIPWNEDGTETDQAEDRVGQRIAEELDARGIGRPPALVAVGRGSIELRQLQLPPAPDEELPDLVRFQAAREFNELDEHWLLDFVPIDQGTEGARTVLAMAIAPAVIRHIEGVCQRAGLKMQRLLLRPCAAASLLTGGMAGAKGELRLLVDLLSDEVDLTAVCDGNAVFLRTMRVGGGSPPLPALLAEIRLTMAAVQSQSAGRQVEAIVLCGQDEIHAELARSAEAELAMPVQLFDPFGGFDRGSALRGLPLEHPGRFAPLLGMCQTELRQQAHAVDFLHPRHRAPPPSKRRKWIVAGSAAAALLLAYIAYARIENYVVASKVAERNHEIELLDKKILAPEAKQTRDAAALISKWTGDNTIWLDKLLALNKGFPPAQEAMLRELTVVVRQNDVQVDLKGSARDVKVIEKMEERMRARVGEIASKSSGEDPTNKEYSWQFDHTVKLGRERKP
jgi:Tfp pilus assembly PilM family ATPase